MARGVVKFFHDERGWGAISSDELPEGLDAWVHYSMIESDDFRGLRTGEVVDFDYEQVRQDNFHYRATRVRKL